MNIKFLQDYSGRETAMVQFHEGDIVDMSFPQASELVRLGVAEAVEDFEDKPAPVKIKKVKHDTNPQ